MSETKTQPQTSFADKAGKWFTNSAHAQAPGLLARHRLYNAAGMFGSFVIGAKLRDVMQGFDSKGEIDRADVLAPFRFLHGVLAHNPHSDAMEDRWKRFLCQMIPAVFGAAGAILGSVYFFQKSGREKDMGAIKQKASGENPQAITLGQADDAAAHMQAWPLRLGAGIFATFSAASGLTVLYGFFLNNAFSSAQNRKMFSGLPELTGINAFRLPNNTTNSTQHGPVKVMGDVIKATEKVFKEAADQGLKELPAAKVEALQTELVGSLAALFPEHSKENEATMRTKVTDFFNNAYKTAIAEGQEIPNPTVAIGKVKDAMFDGEIVQQYNQKSGEKESVDKRSFTTGVKFVRNFLMETLGMKPEQITPKLANTALVRRLTNPFLNMNKLEEAFQLTVKAAEALAPQKEVSI